MLGTGLVTLLLTFAGVARPVGSTPICTGQIGDLALRGGFELAGVDELSGLLVDRTGTRLAAVAENGERPPQWILGTLVFRERVLTGLTDLRIFTLWTPEPSGDKQYNPESLARVSGQLFVATEQPHGILEFDGRLQDEGWPGIGWPASNNYWSPPGLPPALMKVGEDWGLEAITDVGDELLLIAESARRPERDPATDLWIGLPGQWRGPFRYPREPADTERWKSDCRGSHKQEKIGYLFPTAATTLPDGDVLLLERRYCVARVVRVSARALSRLGGSSTALSRKEMATLAYLEPGHCYPTDNFEAIAAWQGAGGETLILVASDDNAKDPDQRTLFLLFELRAQVD